MTHVALFLFLFVFGLPVALYAEIEVVHDRFSGNVTVKTKYKVGNKLNLIGTYEKNGQPRTVVQVLSQSKSWRYLTCHQTYWLVDGKSFQLPQPTHDGSVSSGYVLEDLTIRYVSLEQIQQLAEAKKVEFKVCTDEYEATTEEMNDFRDFLSKMRENAPKKSP